MKEKNENPKPFTKGKVVVKTLITLLLITVLNDTVEMIDYLLPILKSLVDFTVDWITQQRNNSKTKN